MKTYGWNTPAYERMREALLQDITLQITKHFMKQAFLHGDKYISEDVQVSVDGTQFRFTMEEIKILDIDIELGARDC